MIVKETWNIGTDRDNKEKLTKYNMSLQYHKKHFFSQKTFSSNIKQSTAFPMNDSFFNTMN